MDGDASWSTKNLHLVDSVIAMELDTRSYRLEAIKKTAYRFADRCTAVLGALVGERLPVALHFKASVSESSAREVARLFFQELLDQELREQIAVETNSVRALILAHAFSKADLIKREP